MRKWFIILAFLPLVGFSQLNDTVLWHVDFENRNIGIYTIPDAEDDFAFGGTTSLGLQHGFIGTPWGTPPDSTNCVLIDSVAYFNKVMKAQFPYSTYLTQGGVDFQPILQDSYTELYLSYDIYFPVGWEKADGGKLFGTFSGGDEEGIDPLAETFDPAWGWLLGFMWNEDGKTFWYRYDHTMSMPGYGVGHYIDTFIINPGRWYNFSFRVVVNSAPESYDGMAEFFVNKKLVNRITGLDLKQNAGDNINEPRLNLFYGGSSECTHQTWRREEILSDNFVVWKPDTVGYTPQGNSEYWDYEDTIPVPYTGVTTIGWEYYAPPTADCPVSNTFTDSCGRIVYWDSIYSYPENVDCNLNIEVPGADSIQLYFTSFYSEGECGKYDYFDIRQTNVGGTLVESMYGVTYSFPYIVNVTGNDVYTNFHSDATTVGTGIRMYYFAYKDGAMLDSTLYKSEILGVDEVTDTTDYEYHMFSGLTYGSNGYSLSQSFTVGTVGLNQAHSIDSIAVKLYTESVTDSITFDLYAELNDTLTGSSLSYGVLKSFPTSGTIDYVDMTSYTLQANTSYLLVMSVHGSGFIFWAQDQSNGYLGGMSAYKWGDSWWQETDYDMWFEIWGHTVSESSTLSQFLFDGKTGVFYSPDKSGKTATFLKP